MSVTSNDVYYYVRDLIMSSGVKEGHHNSYIEYKIKDVKIHSIKENFDSRFTVEYSVEIYRPIDSGFVPDKGKWISDTMTVDMSKIEIQRDIKINRLLNPDK